MNTQNPDRSSQHHPQEYNLEYLEDLVDQQTSSQNQRNPEDEEDFGVLQLRRISKNRDPTNIPPTNLYQTNRPFSSVPSGSILASNTVDFPRQSPFSQNLSFFPAQNKAQSPWHPSVEPRENPLRTWEIQPDWLYQWAYDCYLTPTKYTPLPQVVLQLEKKHEARNKNQQRVDDGILEMSGRIIYKRFTEKPIRQSFAKNILRRNEVSYGVMEKINFLVDSFAIFFRVNESEKSVSKKEFGILINPVDLVKNEKFLDSRYQPIREYCSNYNYEDQREILEMNEAKTVVRAAIYNMLMTKYFIQWSVKQIKFKEKFKCTRPIYLGRFLKKLGMEMGQDGEGRYDEEKQCRRVHVMRSEYKSLIEKALEDLEE